jgi:hypothetical protein
VLAKLVRKCLLPILFRKWRSTAQLRNGYSVVLISPMDMPFLLRFALEGLARMDLEGCREVIVVPDGWGDDGGAALREAADAASATLAPLPIVTVNLRRRDTLLTRSLTPPGCADTHWLGVVRGTERVTSKYAFLHDADAFFVDPSALKAQYTQALDQGMYTLGVTPRWDADFVKLGYQIPGTWELMYSIEWARSRPPHDLRGRRMNTPHGRLVFDSMLYPQFLDYESGKVGVMKNVPDLVHFNGTIFSYRIFRDSRGQPIADELFRVLLLSLLESVLPGSSRVTPLTSELAQGLNDASRPVHYVSESARRGYPEFRQMIGQLTNSPVLAGERAAKLLQLIEPFDLHFSSEVSAGVVPAVTSERFSGIGR